MGTYLNPGNSGFEEIVRSDYVDKTGLISLINSTIGTKRNLTCVSRPRRFGKSFAAQMLCAYYDKSCDSHGLFAGLKIAKDPTYEKHLGKYDVIYWDMTQLMGEAGKDSFIDFIMQKVTEELLSRYPEVKIDSAFSTTLINAVEHTGNRSFSSSMSGMHRYGRTRESQGAIWNSSVSGESGVLMGSRL